MRSTIYCTMLSLFILLFSGAALSADFTVNNNTNLTYTLNGYDSDSGTSNSISIGANAQGIDYNTIGRNNEYGGTDATYTLTYLINGFNANICTITIHTDYGGSNITSSGSYPNAFAICSFDSNGNITISAAHSQPHH